MRNYVNKDPFQNQSNLYQYVYFKINIDKVIVGVVLILIFWLTKFTNGHKIFMFQIQTDQIIIQEHLKHLLKQ